MLRFYAMYTNLTLQHSIQNLLQKLPPNGTALSITFSRLRTVADMQARSRKQRSTLRLPKLKENPSLSIRGKEHAISK